MHITFVSLMLIWFIDEAYCCESQIKFNPCKTRRDKINGFRCISGDRKCISSDLWCRLDDKSLWAFQQCNDDENLHSSSCFEYKFDLTAGDIEYSYLLKKISSDWFTAEMFCQRRNYHLFSPSDDDEIDAITSKLNYLIASPKNWARRAADYKDPMGEICRATGGIPGGLGTWMGTYYSYGSKEFKNSDGSKPKLQHKSSQLYTKDIGSELGGGFTSNRYHIWWNISEPVSRNRSSGRNIRHTNTQPNAILCKRPKTGDISKWDGGLAKGTDCITGYQCAGSKKCILGPTHQHTQLCDAREDCPKNDDELLQNCPHYNISAPNDNRTFVFFPLLHSFYESLYFCQSQGLTLPSVHSEKDQTTLAKSAADFSHNLPKNHFMKHILDWKGTNGLEIRLGRRVGEWIWDDKSKVGFTSNYDTNKDLNEDEYIALIATPTSSTITSKRVTNDDVAVTVCQEGRAPSHSGVNIPDLRLVGLLIAINVVLSLTSRYVVHR